MPFYLKEKDVVPEVVGFKSALIVPCRFCPAASLAVRGNQPFIELLRGHLKTECYEEFIANLRSRLKRQGVRTGVFGSSIFSYAHCMWTSGKREKLLSRASEYEAVVVLGCDGAYESVCDIVKSADCVVLHGMESEGILSLTTKFGWPFKISLGLAGLTRMHRSADRTEIFSQ